MDKDKELLLDTKGACFLCLRPLHPPVTPVKSEDGKNEEPASSHSIELNLRVICRYLKIDLKYLLLQVLGRDCPADLYTCDLSVMLCGGCGRVTERLSQLARELEELQMRVDYQVQQFHGLLKGDGGRWEAVKEGMMAEGRTEEALVEVQLVELLRREASTKGGALVKRSAQYPVVKLDRIKTEDPQEVPEEDFTGSDEETLINICRGHYKSLDMAKGQGFHCFPCGGRTFPDPNPREHLFSAHPHLFFQDVKQDNLSKDHFNALCRHALQLELGKARVFLQDTKTIAECAHCHQRLRNLSATFHHHLMVKHHSRVSNSVIAIQAQQQKGQGQVEPPVRTKRRAPTPSTPFTQWLTRTCFQFYGERENGRMECQLCNRKQEVGHAKRHVINCHPEKLFLRDKLADVNETQLRLCCDYLFQGEITRARVGKGLQCPQCPWKGVANHLFRNHLVWKHLPQLRDKMKTCQREQVWNRKPINMFTPVKHIPRGRCPPVMRAPQHPEAPPRLVPLSGGTAECGPRISQSPFTAWLIRTCYQYCGKKEKGRIECLVCNRKLVTNHATRHVVQCHAEKLFLRDQLPNVNEVQLKACSDYFFQGEIRRAKKPGNVLQCLHCPWKGKFVHLFRNHLVWRHFPQLREIVKQHQTEEIWKGDGRKIISGRGRPVGSRKIISKGKISHGTTPQLAVHPTNSKSRRGPTGTPFTTWLTRTCDQYYRKITTQGRLECLVCHGKMDASHSKRHVVQSHPEKLFLRDQLENVTESQLNVCCEHLFQQEITSAGTKGGNMLQCPHCAWKGGIRHLFRNHLVWAHFPELRNKVKTYQRNEIWNKTTIMIPKRRQVFWKGKSSRKTTSRRKTSGSLPKNPLLGWISQLRDQLFRGMGGVRIVCRLCNLETDRVNGRNHLIYNHPEKVLARSRLEGVTEAKFEQCCRHLFQGEYRGVIQKTGSKKCGYCQAPVSQSQHYAIHLVTHHLTDLERKLRTYQEQRVWEKAEDLEEEEDFVPGEESEPLVEMQVLADEQEEDEEIVTVKMEDILMPDFDQENICVEEEVAEDMIFVPEVHLGHDLENSYGERRVDDVLLERYITEKDFMEEGGDAEMCPVDDEEVSSGLWDLD